MLPSLTINVGLRYELYLPQQETSNKLSQFDFSNGTLLTGTGLRYSVDTNTCWPPPGRRTSATRCGLCPPRISGRAWASPTGWGMTTAP